MVDIITFAAASGAILVLTKCLRRRRAATITSTDAKPHDITAINSTETDLLGLHRTASEKLCIKDAVVTDLTTALGLRGFGAAKVDSRNEHGEVVEVGRDGYEIVDVTKSWEEKHRQDLESWDFGGDDEW